MRDFKQRRDFLKVMTAGASALTLPSCLLPAQEKGGKQTFTFKTVDKLDIKADVYGASDDKIRPVVIWVHGGALIVGHRGSVDATLRDRLLKAGYVMVSIDYRLAPETKVPGILEDVQDAYRWVREKGPKLFHIDPARIAVAGGSAGGYLTQTTGYRVEPRPRALVSFWGYGDIAGPWYSRPDPFYRTKPLVAKEDAYKQVGGPPLTEPTGAKNRGQFYLYCRQNGLWPKEVAGLDPDKEPKAFDPFCPARNVSAKYPPTLLIHGTKDTDVPYELSVQMDKELTRHKVEHELITITDGPHGLGGVKPEVVAKMYDRVMEFLNKQMR
jgi:acetyl esterase/lipase